MIHRHLYIFLLFALSGGVCGAQSVKAQRDTTEKRILFLGPEVGMTLGMNTVDYHVENVKRSVGFNIAAGAVFCYKFEGENALLGGLHYYSLAYSDVNEYVAVNNNQQNTPYKITTKGTFSYIALSAMLKASVVLIGFQVGIPIDGSATIELGGSTGRSGTSVTNAIGAKTVSTTEKMKVLFEPRLGFEFPLMSQTRGDLVLGFTFGYPVGTMSDPPFSLPLIEDNYRIPNMKVHASYRFSLGRDAKD